MSTAVRTAIKIVDQIPAIKVECAISASKGLTARKKDLQACMPEGALQ